MIAEYLNIILIAFFWLFIAFVFVMKIKHKVINTPYEKPAMVLFGYPFIVFDWLVNWAITPLFLDMPASKGELVTGRMKRYKKIPTWRRSVETQQFLRYSFAVWLCKLLNQHDKNHC